MNTLSKLLELAGQVASDTKGTETKFIIRQLGNSTYLERHTKNTTDQEVTRLALSYNDMVDYLTDEIKNGLKETGDN